MYIIQLAIFLVVLSSVAPQRWPKERSCAPCQCSVRPSKYTYGLVKYVNCSNRGLQSVPRNMPPDLDFLDLSFNNIDPATLGDVCDFDSLQFLSLAYNDLTRISGSPFMRCSLLVKLELTGNPLENVENSSFTGLLNLHTMYGLEAEHVEFGAFEKMNKLKNLDFIFCGQTIPDVLFVGLPVETLNLTLNEVQNIPRGLFEFGAKTLQFLCLDGLKVNFLHETLFRGLTVLRKVHLNMPGLTTLPERLFSNFSVRYIKDGDPQNLEEIILKSMKTIPMTIFKDLESLERLSIHHVPEIAISGLFDDLVNLEMLDLSNSSIVQIPHSWFSKLYSLKTLKLKNCSLHSIEDQSLTGLPNLKTLELSMNALRVMPLKTFDPLRNSVQNLLLRGNMLKYIDSQLLQHMLALQYLDLSDNKISNISVRAFSDLKLLNFLNLEENKLTWLPENLFQHQTNLQELHLGKNSFRRVPLSAFSLTSDRFLRRLYMNNNIIVSLPPRLPSYLPYLEYISLMGNNVQCRCRLLSLRLYKPNLYIDGLCAGPKWFVRRHVMMIPIPDQCPGPRPTPEERSAAAIEPTMSSILHFSYHYDNKDNYDNYYYYYYGSDEYYVYNSAQFIGPSSSSEAAAVASASVEQDSSQTRNETTTPSSTVDIHSSSDDPYFTSTLHATEPLPDPVTKSPRDNGSTLIVTTEIDDDITDASTIVSSDFSTCSNKDFLTVVAPPSSKGVDLPNRQTTSKSTISPTSAGGRDDNTAIMEVPGVSHNEVKTTGMAIEVKGIVGFLGFAAVVCICGTLYWLKNQIARRRMYQVTASNTVV